MAFKLTDEQRMIQLMVREFAKKEIEPVASEYDQKEIFPKENLKKMAELGLMGMMIPPEYGGSGVGTISYSIAMQEIAYACASTSVAMSVSNLSCEPILMFGTEEQRRRFLTPLASGKYLGAFALTEPEAGSDPASLRTTAVLKGDSYLINGSKTFISNGSYADIIIVTARTQEGVGGRGLSSFILERGTPGFSTGKKEDKMGLRASDTVELVFEDCQIPKENLLGKEGDGFEIVMVALDGGRIGIASQAVGIAQACLDESVKYAKSRQQFGKYISKFQAIQWMIADMTTEIEAARLLTFNAALMKDEGLNFTREVSMAKLFASEMVNRVAYKAVQIHGGYGYIKDYKVERLYRDARATTIYEGTSEVQRIVIAKSALK